MNKDEAIFASLRQTGWATESKARRMYDLVHEAAFKFADNHESELISVELGVFYGRSLLPMGFAHKQLDVGYTIGFDAYDNSVCVEGTNDERNNEWWSRQDLNAAHESVQTAIELNDLADYCIVSKCRSDEAAKQFKDNSVSILHLDSSHNGETISSELTLWTPKMKNGATLIADDVLWAESIGGYAKLPQFGYVLKEDFGEWQIWVFEK